MQVGGQLPVEEGRRGLATGKVVVQNMRLRHVTRKVTRCIRTEEVLDRLSGEADNTWVRLSDTEVKDVA